MPLWSGARERSYGMSFGEFIGKVVALPIRIVNVPARAVDRALDLLDGEESEPVFSEPGDDLADAIEDIARHAIEGRRK